MGKQVRCLIKVLSMLDWEIETHCYMWNIKAASESLLLCNNLWVDIKSISEN